MDFFLEHKQFIIWYCVVCFVLAILYLIPTFRRRKDESAVPYLWRCREHWQVLAGAGVFCPPLWILSIIYYFFKRKVDCPQCGGHKTVMFSHSNKITDIYPNMEDNWFVCSECGYTEAVSHEIFEGKKRYVGSSDSDGGGGDDYSYDDDTDSGGDWGGGSSDGGGAGRSF